jgi:hypothetical protein
VKKVKIKIVPISKKLQRKKEKKRKILFDNIAIFNLIIEFFGAILVQ